MIEVNKFKKQQILYYRRKWSGGEDFSQKEPILCNYFSYLALDMVVRFFPIRFKKKKVLIVAGGGEGYEFNKMRELGCDVTVSDISPEALRETKRRHRDCRTVLADAEKLPFSDNSFDIGLIKDGLHHLLHPEQGIKELWRVSREAVLFIDFQETFVTKFLIKTGFSPKYEESGNLNFHFRRNDLIRLFSDLKVKKYKMKSYFGNVPIFTARILNNRPGTVLVKIIFIVFNFFFSRWGNILVVGILKK